MMQLTPHMRILVAIEPADSVRALMVWLASVAYN